MEREKIFRTKSGFCHVTTDKIILTRDGVIGSLAAVTVGNNVTRLLITYGILSTGLLYFAYDYYSRRDFVMAFLFGLFGMWLIYGIIKSSGNSVAPVIERKDIKAVSYNPGMPGLTRARFEVEFNENGKVRKRLIELPGTLAGGQIEADKAVAIMRAEKLLR